MLDKSMLLEILMTVKYIHNDKVWLKKGHVQKLAIGKKSTFFFQSSWNLLKMIAPCTRHRVPFLLNSDLTLKLGRHCCIRIYRPRSEYLNFTYFTIRFHNFYHAYVGPLPKNFFFCPSQNLTSQFLTHLRSLEWFRVQSFFLNLESACFTSTS